MKFLIILITTLFFAGCNITVRGQERDNSKLINYLKNKTISSVTVESHETILEFTDGTKVRFSCYKYPLHIQTSVNLYPEDFVNAK